MNFIIYCVESLCILRRVRIENSCVGWEGQREGTEEDGETGEEGKRVNEGETRSAIVAAILAV